MNTGSSGAGVERATALLIYQLADYLVQFRYYTELNYARAEPYETGGENPSPPSVIDSSFGQVLATATRLATDLAMPEAGALASAARAVHRQCHEVWLNPVHRAQLAERRESSQESDFVNEGEHDWRVVLNSPLGPFAWDELNTAVARLTERLPNCYCLLFELARTIAEVKFPFPSSYDAEIGNIPVFDIDHLLTTLGPRIASLTREAGSHFQFLRPIEGWLGGAKPYKAACEFRSRVLSALKEDLANNKPAVPNVAPQSSSAVAPASTTAQPSLRAGEDVAALIEMKRRIDEKHPNHVYIGRSLPVLRMFRQIEDLNRRPDESVVVLGPSGCGKTELAHVIHILSARGRGPFRHLQASDVSGGDEGIVRDRWVGRGHHSGLGSKDDNGPVRGWLQECAGGTVFLDELHNLDLFNQEFLRKVLDRKPIPVAAGRGPDVQPDVRLIFATYCDMKELGEKRALAPDFVRRLGNRFITVPSLNDRKEDIPLFVEKFCAGRKPDLGFILALLKADWSKGQVGQLIQAIKTAVSRRSKGEAITAADLDGEVPEEVLTRVAQTPAEDARRGVLSFLKSALQVQGFATGGRDVGLQTRLAEILSVSEPTISRWLKDAGLRDGASGDE